MTENRSQPPVSLEDARRTTHARRQSEAVISYYVFISNSNCMAKYFCLLYLIWSLLAFSYCVYSNLVHNV